jgi:predicted RNA binding protein YcfA (HicA-like mRNA interferase family)
LARLTPVDARTMDRLLKRLGFARVRQRGSHVFYRHPDGRTTTVPHHKGRDLSVPLIRAILADVQLSPEEFLHRLQS